MHSVQPMSPLNTANRHLNVRDRQNVLSIETKFKLVWCGSSGCTSCDSNNFKEWSIDGAHVYCKIQKNITYLITYTLRVRKSVPMNLMLQCMVKLNFLNIGSATGLWCPRVYYRPKIWLISQQERFTTPIQYLPVLLSYFYMAILLYV